MLVLVVVLGAVVAFYVRVGATTRLLDLEVYRAGGAAVFSGNALYQVTVSGYPFTYPPASALLMFPVAHLPTTSAHVIWTLSTLVCLWFVVVLCLRRYGTSSSAGRFPLQLATFIVVAVSDPLWTGLHLGQINVFVFLLVVLDLTGTWPRIPRGVLIGVAAAIKLTPLFLVIYLLVVGRNRDAVRALATFVVVGGLAFVATPAASASYWFSGGMVDLGNFGLPYVSNQSLHGVTARLVGDTTAGRTAWIVLSVLTAAAVLFTVRRIVGKRPWLAEAMALATIVLISPVSWIHHWIFVLPLVVAGFRMGFAPHGRWTLGLTIALALALIARPIWWVRLTYHESWPRMLLADSDVALLLMLLGVLVVQTSAWRPRGATGVARPPGGPQFTG